MEEASLFDPTRVARVEYLPPDGSGLLELVARVLTAGDPPEVAVERAVRITELLAARERVASTAVGDGVAFPHAKIPGLEAARAALIVLPPPGVDLGAPDGLSVRLVMGLVVPPDSVGEHLKILGVLARRFRRPPLREAILAAPDAAAILSVLEEYHDHES